MATTTSITTSYSGEFSSKYISAALLSASTIENGGVEVMPNIKFKQVIQKLEIDGIVKDATCDFDATSTLTMTERVLQVEDFQVNLQLCKKDFHSTWQSMEMGMSSFDNLPSSFQDYLIAHVASKVAQKQEQNLWRGVNANAGEYDGLVTLATADADVVDVAAANVNSANVIAELGKIVDAIPSALYGKEDLNIYVSQNIARAYVRALGGFAAAGLGSNGSEGKGTQWFNNGALSFDGVSVFVAQGLADNNAMAAESSNLFFGTSLMSDSQEVKVLDMTDLDGSDNVRVIMKFAAGAQYGIGSDIVLYS